MPHVKSNRLLLNLFYHKRKIKGYTQKDREGGEEEERERVEILPELELR